MPMAIAVRLMTGVLLPAAVLPIRSVSLHAPKSHAETFASVSAAGHRRLRSVGRRIGRVILFRGRLYPSSVMGKGSPGRLSSRMRYPAGVSAGTGLSRESVVKKKGESGGEKNWSRRGRVPLAALIRLSPGRNQVTMRSCGNRLEKTGRTCHGRERYGSQAAGQGEHDC